jgi:predicted enzyme related to lactoylglutathione lyase
MSEDSARGQFVWYDLMTTDPEAAQAFYTSVVGWGTQVWENAGMSYTMWTAGDTPIGGIMKLPDEAVAGGARPHWVGYVAVPDTDATVARAQELGGKVMVPPTDIPTVGRFAVIADPQGALTAPFTPQGTGPGPKLPPPVGHFSWHELATTTDSETAFAFYADLFGWQKTSAMDMGDMGVYQMFGPGGVPFGGIYKKPAEQPGPPSWLHYARVPDVNAAVEAVRQKGGQVLNGPMEVPGGDMIAMILDPQGGPSAVHEKKSAQS